MKTISEFTDKEQKHFYQLLERAVELIDWTSMQRAVDIFNKEGQSTEFWNLYCHVVEPIADPYSALVNAGVELNDVDCAMFTSMAEDIYQNPDNEVKYWSGRCQSHNWDLFLKILNIIKEVGY